MADVVEFRAQKGGDRLDKLIVARVGERLSRAQIQGLIKAGAVTVDGAAVKAGQKLKGGELIHVHLPDPTPDETVMPEALPLNVIYEDSSLAVIDKPAGLVVHPGAGNRSGTLVNALLARYPKLADMPYDASRRGIVHRLDKDTSGLLVVALRSVALRRLMAQFQARTVEKVYFALVERIPRTSTGRIEAPIGRDPHRRTRMMVSRDGLAAVSEFTVVETFKSGRALLRVRLLTGRTHQIRVHLAFIDCPIVGDRVYGFRKPGLSRQFLHAAQLCFDHPRTGERLCFESPLPNDLDAALARERLSGVTRR
jgi:23S rRNA pseudouridine1911/1915/1917 synthase